jgi:hypothetical protein
MIERINDQIKTAKAVGFDASEISDGYHTFKELYEHRYLLFLNFAKANIHQAWKFRKNADGQEWPGWFGLGVFPDEGEQITYHLPIKYWDAINCSSFDINPYFDGHNSDEVLVRLATRLH